MAIRSTTSKVQKVSAIRPTSASSAVGICRTSSITSDSFNAWIARRQSTITAGFEKVKANRLVPPTRDEKPRSTGQSVAKGFRLVARALPSAVSGSFAIQMAMGLGSKSS